MGDLMLVGLESGLPCHKKDCGCRRVPPTITLVGILVVPHLHVNAQPRTRNRTESRNTGSQGRRAKTLSRALDADSEAAPVRRAAGERGRRSIAARGERLHHLRLIRTLHPRARACSVRAREDGLAGWCGRSSYGSDRNRFTLSRPELSLMCLSQ